MRIDAEICVRGSRQTTFGEGEREELRRATEGVSYGVATIDGQETGCLNPLVAYFEFSQSSSYSCHESTGKLENILKALWDDGILCGRTLIRVCTCKTQVSHVQPTGMLMSRRVTPHSMNWHLQF